MAITVEQINFIKYSGIYYTDQVTFTTGQGTLTCGSLVFTSDAALINTRIDQISAKHLRGGMVLIRGKV